jgi:hypothetical protein
MHFPNGLYSDLQSQRDPGVFGIHVHVKYWIHEDTTDIG